MVAFQFAPPRRILSLGLCAGFLALFAEDSDAPTRASPRTPVAAAATAGLDLDRLQHQIASREYHASRNGVGLQAPNRVHDLRTYFDAEGIRVHGRTAPGSPELLALAVVGVGREGALAPLAPGDVTSEEGRVEIRREGIVEWYLNSPAGLEQGFTLAQRPVGEGPLVLELGVRRAAASLRDGAVTFATPGNRRLRYGNLAANDASGRTLTARLSVPGAQTIRILIEDEGASYPLVIDPLLTETSDTQLEANQVGARMGYSVASAGDVNGDGYADVIVGADLYDSGQSNEGAAFVFLGSASGIADAGPSTAPTRLESNQAQAHLGSSVASAGDVNGDGYADVIVGASS